MKKFVFTSVCLFMVSIIWAQVPDGFNYQSVIRDIDGQIIASSNVILKFSILQGSIDGAVLFSETHDIITNELGIANTVIGQGEPQTGIFSQIDWANGPYFLQTAIDQNTSGNFTVLGATQLLSVPYAMNANQAAHSKSTSLFYGGQEFILKVSPEGDIYTEKGPFHCGGDYYDPRDGQTYETVQIGEQCWMKENLNYESDSSWCFQNDTANCSIYGRLYTQNMASKVCPEGWHLPNNDEWCELATLLDETVDCNAMGATGTDAGGKLKSTGNLWQQPNVGATNESGFTALPAGWLHGQGFWDLHNTTRFWSATISGPDWFYYWGLQFSDSKITRTISAYELAFSVRCIKNQ